MTAVDDPIVHLDWQGFEGTHDHRMDSVSSWLHQLGGPSWIVQRGNDPSRSRAVVTLLHGNEPSGVRAVFRWLNEAKTPKTNAVFYIGSVQAALAAPGFAHRNLPGQRDANRTYRPPFDDTQGRIAESFIQRFCRERFEALVDIHNNTGENPAYSVGFGLDPARVRLGRLFGAWYVHTELELGTLVELTAKTCPSIAVECGLAGSAAADETAYQGLVQFLLRDDLELQGTYPEDVRVLSHPIRVELTPKATLGFASAPIPGVDLTLREDIDQYNFQHIEAGTPLGWLNADSVWPFVARDAAGRDESLKLLTRSGTELHTARPLWPMMLTTSAVVAKQDCLFYAVID